MKKIYIIILFVLSLYFVIGGISNILIREMFEIANELPENPVYDIFDGKYRNIEQQNASIQNEKMLSFFPIYESQHIMSYLLTLICFGCLGSIIRLLLIKMSNNISLGKMQIIISPILGGLLGLLALIFAELIPEFKHESGNYKFYYTLALLGGIYTKEFFHWLEIRFRKLLQN